MYKIFFAPALLLSFLTIQLQGAAADSSLLVQRLQDIGELELRENVMTAQDLKALAEQTTLIMGSDFQAYVWSDGTITKKTPKVTMPPELNMPPAAPSTPDSRGLVVELQRIGSDLEMDVIDSAARLKDFAQQYENIGGDLENYYWVTDVFFAKEAQQEIPKTAPAVQTPSPAPSPAPKLSPIPRSTPQNSSQPSSLSSSPVRSYQPSPSPAPDIPSVILSAQDSVQRDSLGFEIPQNTADITRIWEEDFRNNDWSQCAAEAFQSVPEQMDLNSVSESYRALYQLVYCRLREVYNIHADDAAARALRCANVVGTSKHADRYLVKEYNIAIRGLGLEQDTGRRSSLAPKPRTPAQSPARSAASRAPSAKPSQSSASPSQPGFNPAAVKGSLRRTSPVRFDQIPPVEENIQIIEYRQSGNIPEYAERFQRLIYDLAQAVQNEYPAVRGQQNLTEAVVLETAFFLCGQQDNVRLMEFSELKDISIQNAGQVADYLSHGASCRVAMEIPFGQINKLADADNSEAFNVATTRPRLFALNVMLQDMQDKPRH